GLGVVVLWGGGRVSGGIGVTNPCCLLASLAALAELRTFCTAGISNPIRIARTATTTSNSIRVNPPRRIRNMKGPSEGLTPPVLSTVARLSASSSGPQTGDILMVTAFSSTGTGKVGARQLHR